VHAAPTELVARYFDHAATSFPKPAAVALGMARYLDEIGGTYGRAAYGQVQDASRIVFETREKLARAIGCSDSSRIAFTLNATHALNIAIRGLARPNGVALVSPVEHNSVMRPLHALAERTGLRVEILPSASAGRVLPEAIRIPNGACVAVVTHESNVNGAIQPLDEIKAHLGDVPLVVDAAQSAGEIPIDVERLGADAVALSGHKHLLGPTGVGALYVREDLALPALVLGGTGSRSESLEQPDIMPDALESGTPNVVGIAGLRAALEFLETCGEGNGPQLALRTIAALEALSEVRILKAANPEHQGGLFSFAVDGVLPSEIARRLYESHRLAVRAGLQCAPAAHRTFGTSAKGGTVRVAFGRFHDESAVSRIATAIEDVVRRR
jgi:cysteine desulfurase family protein